MKSSCTRTLASQSTLHKKVQLVQKFALGCRLVHTSDQSVGNRLELAIDLWVS